MPDDSLSALEQILIRLDLDLPHFHAHDVARIQPEKWRAILASGLVRRTADAEWVRCECYDEHGEDVEFAPAEGVHAGAPYIQCPDLGVVWIEPERLRQWTVDVPLLVEQAAAVIACTGRVEEVVPGHLWLLGRMTAHGRTREVFLARELTWPRRGVEAVDRCARFRAAVSPLLLVPQVVPQRHEWTGGVPRVLTLTSVLALEGSTLVADRAYVESAWLDDAAPPAPAPSPVPRFGTPPGATWEDLELRVRDGESLAVRVLDERRRVTYADMGMADSRTSRPDKQWELLQVYAARGGVLTWDRNTDAARRNKKRTERLAAALRTYFEIPGDPIEYEKATRGWRTRFAALAE